MELSNIKAFVFDIDGVFTDGGILCDLSGELFRTFDAKDSFAVRMAVMKDYPVGIITGGRSKSIRARFDTCGVPQEDIYLGSRNKMEDLENFCRRHGLTPSEIAYIGDDLPDMAVMAECGIGACPSDAVAEVRAMADFVSPYPGGKGCVRDFIEMVMKAQDTWVFDVYAYKKRF